MGFAMETLRDRIFRQYLILLLCFAGLLTGGILLLLHLQSRQTQELMLATQRATASSLLAQGVSETVILEALTNMKETTQGAELLQKAGMTMNTAFSFYPQGRTMLRQTMFMAVPFLFLLILLLFACFTWLAIKKERLYAAAEAVARQYAEDNFTERMPSAEGGPLYRLFGTIDELATALQAKKETEQQAKDFLKKTIADISHQLKTPLAALHMYNEIISQEPDNPQTVQTFSAKTLVSLERMERLIAQLLKITRLDAGSIVFEKEEIAAPDLLWQAAEPFVTRARREGKSLIIEKAKQEDSRSYTVYCDREWTTEALGNLIKNALDYLPQGGHVWVSCEKTPAQLCIYVKDDGAGIAPEDIHHIFKRFYRSKDSVEKPGIGLGLSLAKAIIEEQGGVLSVQSTKGEGAVFTVSFLTKL